MSVKSQAVMQTATEKLDIHTDLLDQLVTLKRKVQRQVFLK